MAWTKLNIFTDIFETQEVEGHKKNIQDRTAGEGLFQQDLLTLVGTVVRGQAEEGGEEWTSGLACIEVDLGVVSGFRAV